MADVPKDMLDQINKLEDLFIVDGQKLKEVTNQFVSELERGLKENDATIVRPFVDWAVDVLTKLRIAYERDLVHGFSRWQ